MGRMADFTTRHRRSTSLVHFSDVLAHVTRGRWPQCQKTGPTMANIQSVILVHWGFYIELLCV